MDLTRRHIIGIDEAGRGPLAGPVVVAGVLMNVQLASQVLAGIKDSKKLSAKQREEWFDFLTTHPRIRWAVSRVSPAVIDRINIYWAAQKGAWRVCGKICPKLSFSPSKLSLGHIHTILLDAGLRLPPHIPHHAIIKGDELIPVISAASIIAKVTRDRAMMRLHEKYPVYRFDLHKGYSTKLHRDMIAEFGRCEAHRKSFRCIDRNRYLKDTPDNSS